MLKKNSTILKLIEIEITAKSIGSGKAFFGSIWNNCKGILNMNEIVKKIHKW